MQYTRDEYLALMRHEPTARPMFSEMMGLMPGPLLAQWQSQGATPAECDLSAFGFDWVDYADMGTNFGFLGGGRTVLHDDDEVLLYTDHIGHTMKLYKKYASMPLPLTYPVANMNDWLALKPRLLYTDDRLDTAQNAASLACRERGGLTYLSLHGAYNFCRDLMGDEALGLAFYDQPELVHDIMATLCDTALKLTELATRRAPADVVCFGEDLAGRSGPLLSPSTFREFFFPYYRQMSDLLLSRGPCVISQDSDGDVSPLLPVLMEAGLTCTYPCEPAAGMDIVQLRQKHGTALSYKGGIDKHVLRRTKADIRTELEYKMQPLMHTGVVFGLDHRITDATPIENYRYYVQTAREILGQPMDAPAPFVRMAF